MGVGAPGWDGLRLGARAVCGLGLYFLLCRVTTVIVIKTELWNAPLVLNGLNCADLHSTYSNSLMFICQLQNEDSPVIFPDER